MATLDTDRHWLSTPGPRYRCFGETEMPNGANLKIPDQPRESSRDRAPDKLQLSDDAEGLQTMRAKPKTIVRGSSPLNVASGSRPFENKCRGRCFARKPGHSPAANGWSAAEGVHTVAASNATRQTSSSKLWVAECLRAALTNPSSRSSSDNCRRCRKTAAIFSWPNSLSFASNTS